MGEQHDSHALQATDAHRIADGYGKSRTCNTTEPLDTGTNNSSRLGARMAPQDLAMAFTTCCPVGADSPAAAVLSTARW